MTRYASVITRPQATDVGDQLPKGAGSTRREVGTVQYMKTKLSTLQRSCEGAGEVDATCDRQRDVEDDLRMRFSGNYYNVHRVT